MAVIAQRLSKKEIAQMTERALPIRGISVIQTPTRSRYDGHLRQPEALILVRPDEKDADLLPFSVSNPHDLILSLQNAVRCLEQWFPPIPPPSKI